MAHKPGVKLTQCQNRAIELLEFFQHSRTRLDQEGIKSIGAKLELAEIFQRKVIEALS